MLCVARENVREGTLHVYPPDLPNNPISIDMDAGDLCLFVADTRVVKDPVRPWDGSFDAWDDIVLIRRLSGPDDAEFGPCERCGLEKN